MAHPEDLLHAAIQAPQTNGMAIAGLVCGIVGLALFWTFLGGIILGVLGLIFGAVGVSMARARGGAGRGMGLAGAICGGLAVVLSILWVALNIARVAV